MRKLPDPYDRTPNEPVELVSPRQVLEFYNENAGTGTRHRVDSRVRKFFATAALDAGWSAATFYGNQCLLSVKLVVQKSSKE